MRRVLCLYLPFLAIERVGRPERDGSRSPLVLTERYRGAERVVQENRAARDLGVRAGMTVAEARAMVPALTARPHEPQRDAERLEALALWAQRFSPLTEAQPPDTILVDVTGCERLFRSRERGAGNREQGGQGSGFRVQDSEFRVQSSGKRLSPDIPNSEFRIPNSSSIRNSILADGEANLLRLAVEGLARQGFWARGVIADTVGAAWATAHAAHTAEARQRIVPPGETVAALLPLPPWSLRLPAAAVDTLDRLGVDKVAALLHLPRAAVAARFGETVLRRIDQATGDEIERLEPLRPQTLPAAGVGFPGPDDRQEALFAAAQTLLASLCEQLERGRAGVRALCCVLYREAHAPESFAVKLSQATRVQAHLWSLLQTRLGRVDLSAGITGLRLWSPATHRLADVQGVLFEDGSRRQEEHGAALAGLVDRLTNRLGREAVVRPQLVSDHQPEDACRMMPAMGHPPNTQNPQSAIHNPQFTKDPRPLRLLARPCVVQVMALVPDGPPTWFRWSGQEHTVADAVGPERIETGWWKGSDVQRDYFLVTSETGCRFWLFRDRRSGRWYVHGCFD